jgi:hypothetical protein
MRRAIYLAIVVLVAIVAIFLLTRTRDQQVVDSAFEPPKLMPRHAQKSGPLVCHDEGHNNFHTLGKRFKPFALLLHADGYQTVPILDKLDKADLAKCRILVIANAQPGDENWDAYPYPTPSAFSEEEAQSLRQWVEKGGALLLIADHMPFPGAAAKIASVFGFEFNDGFAVENFTTEAEGRAAFDIPTLFRTDDGTLLEHPIARGESDADRVTKIRTFTGQAFRAPSGAEPLLRLPKNFISLMPEKAWRFTLQTKRLPVGGWLQGAVMQLGKGRLAVFGDAGMFTAQIQKSSGHDVPMGMNAPHAEQNYRFILNLMRWLSPDVQKQSEEK